MYDYVIVGAGSAGCVLAARLSESPERRVLLLEAGPRDDAPAIAMPAAFATLLRTERDWAFVSVPQPGAGGRKMYWPRGKTLGGSSALNAMIYMRGHRLDYDGWAAAGCEGWGWDDVLPFFRAAEDNSRGASELHGVGGPLAVSDLRSPHPWMRAVVDAAVEAGLEANPDFNGPSQDGAGFNQVTQRRGRRCSAADAYLTPNLGRPNLTVETGAHALRVTFDGERARGVEYRVGGETRHAEARREVLLAGGAVGSPHLLLLSGVGPAEQLAEHGVAVVRELPGVGRHLEDHIAVSMTWAMPEPISLLAAKGLGPYLKYRLLGRGPLTSNVAEACAFLRTRPDLPAPDVQLHFAPVHFDTRLERRSRDHQLTVGPTLLTPASVGSLELASADPMTPPRIDPGYLTDPGGEDLARMVEAVRRTRAILAQPAIARRRGAEVEPGEAVRDDEALEDFVRRRVSTLYHPTGTCKMGVDAMAVVDPELRVHGLRGLRVVDASVMPRIPRGNTNAPTIMLAEKAAALLTRA